MKNPIHTIIVLFSITVAAIALLRTTAAANEISNRARESYHGLSSLSDSVLVDLGEKWFSDRATHARSFAAFSVVVNRHYRHQNGHAPEISYVVEAMHRIGVLYLVSFYKYDQAYRYLSLARQLAEENNLKHLLPYININLANLWEINTMVFPGSYRNGFAYIAEAWDNAISDGNDSLLPVIATNMAILSYARKDSLTFRQQMSHFMQTEPEEKSWNHDFAKSFTAGVTAWLSGDHEAAEKHLLKARDNSFGERDGNRHRMSVLSALSAFYIDRDMTELAGQTLREYSRHIKGNPDFAIDLYNLYTDYFRHLDIPDSIDKYHYLYLKEKEYVADDRKLANVGEKEFLDNIERINEEVVFLSEKNRNQKQQIAVMAAAAICLLMISGTILWAYRRLRSKSEQLYRKNVEMIEEQRQFSARQKELQQEVERLKTRIPDATVTSGSNNADNTQTDNAQTKTAGAVRKTQRPAMSDDDAEKIYQCLTAIMEKGGEIFSPDFSLERLAQLADSKPRTVSAVIGLKHGTNFPQFLNDYRIREACIRFQDTSTYGNYTVEAISESVGYRSRTGFSSLFKKATGLSPSEYQRLARRSNTK